MAEAQTAIANNLDARGVICVEDVHAFELAVQAIIFGCSNSLFGSKEPKVGRSRRTVSIR